MNSWVAGATGVGRALDTASRSGVAKAQPRAGAAPAATIIGRVMTAKEQLLQEAPAWSEHDAEIVLRAVQRERTGGDADERGDISTVHDAAFGDTMRRLSKEERAAGHEPW
jgi:hypothetical protein